MLCVLRQQCRLRSKGFIMLAAFLRSFNALEFLTHCESQVLSSEPFEAAIRRS